MRPPDVSSSPAFPLLDPIILDGDMDDPYQESEVDFMNTTGLPDAPTGAGQEFDDLLPRVPAAHPIADSASASPSEHSGKKPFTGTDPLGQNRLLLADSPVESPENSSPGSSAGSPANPLRDHDASTTSTGSGTQYQPSEWLNHHALTETEDQFFGLDTDMSLENAFPMDADIETSNRVMDSAFDFDSAASSPSPLKVDMASVPKSHLAFKTPVNGASIPLKKSTRTNASDSIPQSGSSFYSNSSREESPGTSSILPRSASIDWDGRSPSSLLEETLGGFTMNGNSPLSTTLSPSLNFGHHGLPFGAAEWPTGRITSLKDYIRTPPQSSSASQFHVRPILRIQPTSLKSRVETQIPIKLTLSPFPVGVKKLRLPSYTISKPKFLAKPETERSPEILELHTSLVCTSAMQDQAKVKKAFARARGEVGTVRSSTSPTVGEGSVEEEKPSEGGEVKICNGCIQRERKRASRKKQRKPDEDELFQKGEDKRVIVFNTSEIKDWTEPPKSAFSGYPDPTVPLALMGAMQVELPMRIACYCRHQNEKLGFQVIFTIKDHLDDVVAQAITNSIMITDDHKTHAPPTPAPAPTSTLPDGQLPGSSVFIPGNLDITNVTAAGSQHFRSSHSSTDLQSLQQQFNSQYPLTPASVAVSQSANTSAPSLTPRNLSRQASPSEFQGPSNKRRKHSGSGKLPAGLTMTKLESSQPSSCSGNATTPGGGSQFSSNSRIFTSSVERPFVTPMTGNGPPTPNGNDNNVFFNPLSQHQNLDGLVQQQLVSAPSSSHPSRPSTPGGWSNLQDPNPNLAFGPWPPLTSTANRLPSIIHKLVPTEGSTTGGTEVTLLGSGFYPGMEVVFGDTLATTTTFWGDKCLNCLTPPALQPGLVPVVFKHEHPTFSPVQHQSQPILPKQQLFFRYVDDRELQMYRLALGILGQKLRNPSDAFQTAQRIMGGDPSALWNMQGVQSNSSGHQRQVSGPTVQGEAGTLDSRMLDYLEFIDLDDSPGTARYNSRSTAGQTLLHFACSLGLPRFVAGLLARGANSDVQDNNGHTPMHLAALSGHAHIIHRLRLAGADALARSIRGFTPADVATSLAAHQAALIPACHYRSRSVGSSPSLRRPSSSASLNSFWETSSASGSFRYTVDNSDHSDQGDFTSDAEGDAHEPIYYYSSSRRSSIHQDPNPSLYYPHSREDSIQLDGVRTPAEASPEVEDSRGFSPPAALVAWRNQLATQIHQFQQSVGRAFPNLPALPALPPMPTLPDYQAHPMMRRISNLVPHRPGGSWSAKDGWWDLLTGNTNPTNTQPPAYEELYPHQEADEDLALKKASLVRAVTDAALDQHFETMPSTSKGTPAEESLGDIRIGRKSISREQQERLRKQQAQKMKGLGSDRNLYFIWIPILLLILCAWLRNLIPGMRQGVSEFYDFIKARSSSRPIEAGI